MSTAGPTLKSEGHTSFLGHESETCWLLQLCTVVGVIFVTKWTLRFLCCLVTYLRATLTSFLWKRNLAAEYGGKWAVVTGSTDGVGKEYAKQLAQKGMNIILISRTLEKMKKVEQEIRKEFGVNTHIIKADFAHGRDIYEGIAEELKGKDIGILVNNVGYFATPQKYINVTEDDMWRFVFVNITSVLGMTKLVLPQMMARKCGAIINISSMAALCPSPYAGVYAATKAFVSSFSHTLEYECRQNGITVQTVEPSFIVTNMTAYSTYMQKPNIWTPTADFYVSNALSTLGYNKTTAGTWNHGLQTFFMKRCPQQLTMYGIEKYVEFLLEEDHDKSQ